MGKSISINKVKKTKTHLKVGDAPTTRKNTWAKASGVSLPTLSIWCTLLTTPRYQWFGNFLSLRTTIHSIFLMLVSYKWSCTGTRSAKKTLLIWTNVFICSFLWMEKNSFLILTNVKTRPCVHTQMWENIYNKNHTWAKAMMQTLLTKCAIGRTYLNLEVNLK